METVLEINLQEDFRGYLYNALPLCILTSDDKYTTWYMENYISCYCDLNPFFVIYDALTYMFPNTLCEIMNFSNIPINILSQDWDINELVKNSIESNMYIIIFLDDFFIPNRFNYQKSHFIHEVLIYGFTDNEYYYVAFDSNNNFTCQKMPTSCLNKAYWETKKTEDLWIKNNSIFLLSLNRIQGFVFKFDRFLLNYKNYLLGRELHTHYQLDTSTLEWGVNTTLALANYFALGVDNNVYMIPPIHLWYEHKVGILTRFKYIHENNLYSDGFPIREIISIYQELVEDANLIRMLNIKNLQSQNLKIKSRLIKRLKTFYNKEKELIELIC